MTAPDVQVGDFIRVFADSGAHRSGHLLRRTLIIEVLAIADPPGRPDCRYLSGRICRRDLTGNSRSQHTAIEVRGHQRSILDMAGQWQLLKRPSRCRGSASGACLSMTEGYDRCGQGECVRSQSTRDNFI